MNDMFSKLLSSLLSALRSVYHFALAWLGAFAYNYPSKSLLLVAVTGTKGKTSVTEMVNAVLEEAGYTTMVANSIRFKIGVNSKPNLTRMSMPGRFLLQKMLREAVDAGCTAAVIEATSEGARQHRHRFLEFDALLFTNLAPEHIESHGSLESYANSKYEIGKQLVRSRKRPRIMIANADDRESARYLTLPVELPLPFSLDDCKPYSANDRKGSFVFEGTAMEVRLPGEFSLKNALAAATLAQGLGIDPHITARGLARIELIPGRAERIEAGQNFTVIVDYAHTPDSLKAIYSAYANSKRICVLGSCGGGRDTWKRPMMGRIAAEQCEHIILTNEDPYDEDPNQIVGDLARGMEGKVPEIIMDRRAAIRRALEIAHASDTVIITGKGTDPSIAGPRGERIPWSDATVAREEIAHVLAQRAV